MMSAAHPATKLGPVSHIGIVVDDCEKAAEWWERIFGISFSTGVYILDESTNFKYRGQAAKSKMKASISPMRSAASASDMDLVFIELVEVMEGESPHTEFMRQHGEGLQHVAFSVDDLDQAVADLAPEGIVPILQYNFVTNLEGVDYRVKEVYLNTAEFPGMGGTTLQLIELHPVDG
jgi:methylmalonyl-CoA/ethylmalonyl-CoA epimerase